MGTGLDAVETLVRDFREWHDRYSRMARLAGIDAGAFSEPEWRAHVQLLVGRVADSWREEADRRERAAVRRLLTDAGGGDDKRMARAVLAGDLETARILADYVQENYAPADPASLPKRPLDDHPWTVRVRKAFRRIGVASWSQLVTRTADDLLEQKNFGMTSLGEVRRALASLGLKLRGDPPPREGLRRA